MRVNLISEVPDDCEEVYLYQKQGDAVSEKIESRLIGIAIFWKIADEIVYLVDRPTEYWQYGESFLLTDYLVEIREIIVELEKR